METLKETKEYTIFKKRSGRYAVKGADGKWVNGVEKVKILNDAAIVKGGMPKPKVKEPQAEEATAEAAPAEKPPTEEPAAEEPTAEESGNEEKKAEPAAE